MPSFKTRIVFALLLCSLLVTTTLFYFMVTFNDSKQINHSKKSPLVLVNFNEVRPNNATLKLLFERKIRFKIENDLQFKQIFEQTDLDIEADEFILKLKSDLIPNPSFSFVNLTRIWNIPKKWVRAREITPSNAPELGTILNSLQSTRIVKSDVSRKGTQLKLLLTLQGGQYALFKPMRYDRQYVPDGIYAGADRHNGEIVAFHLSRILNMRKVPIVASRNLNVLTEIKQVASESLSATFINQTNQNGSFISNCFYGECYYCNEYDSVCPDAAGHIEGAMILMLPLHYKLQRIRNPWQRTYRDNMKPRWENDSHYCLYVRKSIGTNNQERLLDMVETSIFDFIIQNADRHHYEVFKDVSNSALLLIDNGKSFGNASHDEITILFPLLQCCVIRNSTYQHLKKLSLIKISRIINELLVNDPLWPLLTDDHIVAMDRRLVMILAAIEICLETFNKNNVLKA
ncbi:Glycosaminoglycan xylosylkinase [Blomia tropicalis]|nr:Glycosaminoglycan xylosylkinase [Blomia tropicalis]